MCIIPDKEGEGDLIQGPTKTRQNSIPVRPNNLPRKGATVRRSFISLFKSIRAVGIMSNSPKIVVQDYGTNCRDCQRYQKLGDICMIEHGKKFQWEFCRDFEAMVVLPDYKELMRSVRADHALERKKLKEKKDKDKRRRQKEIEEKKELKRKKRRAMLRKRRERLKEKALKEEMNTAKLKVAENHSKEHSGKKTGSNAKEKRSKKTGRRQSIESSGNSVADEVHDLLEKKSNASKT
jgi:hypothetical protein